MTPSQRRFTFAAHVASSVGWLGAVLTFLALVVIGLRSQDDVVVRGAYLVMAPTAWFVLVPLAHASLLSGIALSLGSTWGLFRHYWVVLKLLITVFATVVLLIYMATFREMANVAANPAVDLGLVRNPSPLVHAVLALILLAVATVLGVYKPFGMTGYGLSRHNDRRPCNSSIMALPSVAATGNRNSRWAYAAFALIGLVLLFLVMHLIGATFPH
jgi:hypothetical protein